MKKIVGFGTSAYIFLVTAPVLYAQTGGSSLDPCSNTNAILASACKTKDLGKVLGFVVTIAFVIAILIALLFLLWGGIKWITSGGDKAGVEAARSQIIAAIVGLIIVFLSFFILNLVLGLFGLSLFDLKLPTISGT